MKYLIQLLQVCLFSTNIHIAFAQERNYPANYFQNPLNIPVELAGNFGELRPNHFHTGLDLKTQQKENLPVLAAAEGRVARIAISSTGYGNCLYIEHPNGFTTVYAHLNDFSDKIMKYVRSKQYASKSWQQDITITDTNIAIAKGEFIANSGNTGGSVAPHLHFEIRKTGTDTVYNPMLFGLGVADNRPPTMYQIAIYNAEWSIYMQAPIVINVQRLNDNNFSVAAPIVIPYSSVKIGFTAVDYANNSMNTLGIYKIDLSVDNQPQLGIIFDQLRFSSNRCINAFADYKSQKTIGKWFQGLYKLPGNQLELYNFQNGFDGNIYVSQQQRSILLSLSDFNGNKTSVSFTIASDTNSNLKKDNPCLGNNTWIAQKPQTTNLYGMFFKLSKDALYDNVCPNISVNYKDQDLGFEVQLHEPSVPLHSFQKFGIKLMKPVPFTLRGKLVLLHYIKGANLPGHAAQNALAADFEKGYAVANIRTLGHYAIGIDTIGPKIVLQSGEKAYKQGEQIQISIVESITAVQQMEVYINDQWVCFSRKGNNYYYKVDASLPKGNSKLTVRAKDMNNNISEQIYQLAITA